MFDFSVSPRLVQLSIWLHSLPANLGLEIQNLEVASADASFRRYFRLPTHKNSLIVMDAPPPQEDCAPFVAIAKLFGEAGMHVPTVLAQDLTQGFLLLTDLGQTTYLQALNLQVLNLQTPNQHKPEALYADAIHALVKLQCASRAGVLPEYDKATLQREIDLYPTWYVGKHLGKAFDAGQTDIWQAASQALLANNLAQPKVFVHRDYHCRNLMLTAENNPGVLDFQDALYGPITYDLVSLLRDAYVEWEEPQVIDWCVRYWQAARAKNLPVQADFGEFYRDFEWMGLQRHLKVLGIFARLFHRDGKEGYLKDLPLVLRYTQKAAQRYREFLPLSRMLDTLENRAVQAGYTF